MSTKKYPFPVVRYRNGKPVTWFRSQVVFAEEHEKARARIAELETELAQLREGGSQVCDYLSDERHELNHAHARIAELEALNDTWNKIDKQRSAEYRALEHTSEQARKAHEVELIKASEVLAAERRAHLATQRALVGIADVADEMYSAANGTAMYAYSRCRQQHSNEVEAARAAVSQADGKGSAT